MKYLKSFYFFENKIEKESPKLKDYTPNVADAAAAFRKSLEDSVYSKFGLTGSYSFSETIQNAPEGKFYMKPWKEFEQALPNFQQKFPCLPKKSLYSAIYWGKVLDKTTKEYLYYAIFLILKNSPIIMKEFGNLNKDDFNKLLRLSLLVIDQESWIGTRQKQAEEDYQMSILSGDSPTSNTIKAWAQQTFKGGEASVGLNQMKLSTWNGLEATHKIFGTNNIKSLGTHGNPNPAHFAVAMVASMEYIWDNYKKALNIYTGYSVITANGKKCDYSLGSWAWDVAYNGYTFDWKTLTKKYCNCKFVDNIEKEGPFADTNLPVEPVMDTSKGKTSVYWARDCKDLGSKPIWAEGNFKVIGSNNVGNLEVIPNSIIKGYIPRLYQNKERKFTNRMYLKLAHKVVFNYYKCLGV